jgi:hypothetical protein
LSVGDVKNGCYPCRILVCPIRPLAIAPACPIRPDGVLCPAALPEGSLKDHFLTNVVFWRGRWSLKFWFGLFSKSGLFLVFWESHWSFEKYVFFWVFFWSFAI